MLVVTEIRSSILEGDIDKAFKHTSAYYPHVLEDNPEIVFRLKCRKFVEMIRRCSDLHTPRSVADMTSDHYLTKGHTNANANAHANGHTDVFDEDMELDDEHDNENDSFQTTNTSNGNSLADEEEPQQQHQQQQHEEAEAEDDDDYEANEEEEERCEEEEEEEEEEGKQAHPIPTFDTAKYDQLLQEAMSYGQTLMREYRGGDEKRESRKTLDDIFSLIAYPDAKASVHGHLLETAGRVQVAEELNSAILGKLNIPQLSHLEGGGVVVAEAYRFADPVVSWLRL
jgi:Ran-binding protein 9/10